MANSWSGLRKQLEEDYLCDALKGQVQYFITHYHSAPDQMGRLAIRVGGKELLRANPYDYAVKGYYQLEAQWKKEQNIPLREWTSKGMRYDEENRAVEDAVKDKAIEDGVLEIYDVTDAIRSYTQSSISDSLASDNPLVRLFAVLDRRVGKRTLVKLADTLSQQPDWLQVFYRLRLDAEGITYHTP